MAIPVMILGESGTGKSASLRNFKAEEVAIIDVSGKPLPFRNKLPILKTDKYDLITKAMLSRPNIPAFVVDDAQYLMANEFMRRSDERGYDKFIEIAKNFWSLIQETVSLRMPEKQIVYFLMHTDVSDDGRIRAKTIGKMLNEKITLEGLFTIVLRTSVTDGVYSFRTVNSGSDTVKAPMGMFDAALIDNDLKAVDTIIREYYGFTEENKDKEKVA